MNDNERYEALKKIKGLFDSGVLTEEEFLKEKQRVLSQPQSDVSSKQNHIVSRSPDKNEDKPSLGFDILSFLTGIGGVILYFVTKEDHPIRAKSNLKWGLIGVALAVVFELFFLSLLF